MGMSRRQEALCACLKDKSRVGAATKMLGFSSESTGNGGAEWH